MFQQFPLGCATRKRAFRVTMESLGSLALHRELQTKLPFQFPDQMELRQDVIHQAPTARFSLAHLGRDYMVVAAGREPTESCGQKTWGTRLWCPCSVQAQSSPQLPAKECSAASYDSPLPAAQGWPQLIPALILPWGAARKAESC